MIPQWTKTALVVICALGVMFVAMNARLPFLRVKQKSESPQQEKAVTLSFEQMDRALLVGHGEEEGRSSLDIALGPQGTEAYATGNAVILGEGESLQILDDAYWADEQGINRRQTNLFRYRADLENVLRITDFRDAQMHSLLLSPDKTKVSFIRSKVTASQPAEMLCVYDLADQRLIKVPVSVRSAVWTADGTHIACTARSLHRGRIGEGRWAVIIDATTGKIVSGKRVSERYDVASENTYRA